MTAVYYQQLKENMAMMVFLLGLNGRGIPYPKAQVSAHGRNQNPFKVPRIMYIYIYIYTLW